MRKKKSETGCRACGVSATFLCDVCRAKVPSLQDIDQEVIRWKERGFTNAHIGELAGVSGARIQQIWERARLRLRQAS